MPDPCAAADCEADADFEFYDPETGHTRVLCDDHLEAVDDFFGIRSWLLAGYAVPIEDEQLRGSLPRTPRTENEQRARRSVDQLIRGGSPGHQH